MPHDSRGSYFTEDSPLIDAVFSGLSIFRWNSFPRVQNISTLDHLGFTAHICILISFLEEERGGMIYDKNLLLKKLLFSGFFTFYYSDINAEIKDRLREKSPEIFTQLEEKVLEKLLEYSLSETMNSDITRLQEKTPEDDLIGFAKVWAAYYEVEYNAKIFPDAYEKLLEDLRSKIEKPEYERYLSYIDIDTSSPNPLKKYLLIIQRLASSFRWNRSTRRYPISVLSHTFIIAFITYMITVDEGIVREEQTDMILTAFFHDIPEAITGDIITPTKKSIPGLDLAIEEIEGDMLHRYLLSYIADHDFSHVFARKMLHPWDEPQGTLVKRADILSALHEARIEALYSAEYKEVYEGLRNNMLKLEK